MRDIMRTDAGISGDAQRIEQLSWMLFLKIYDDAEQKWELLEDDYESIIPDSLRWHKWANTKTNSKDVLKGEELLNFVNNELLPGLRDLELPHPCERRQSIVKSVFEDINNYAKDGVVLYELVELINNFDFTDPHETHTFGAIYESLLKELQASGAAGEFYTPRALTDFIAKHVALKLGDKIADFACGTGGFLTSALQVLKPRADAGSNADRKILSHSFYGVEKKALPNLLCVTNLFLHEIDEPQVQHGNALTSNVLDFSESDKFDVILMNPPYGGSEKPVIQMNFPNSHRSSETADLFMSLISYRLKAGGRAAVIIPDGFLFGAGAKSAIKEHLFKNFNVHTIVRLPTSVFAPYTSIATNIIFFDRPAADAPVSLSQIPLSQTPLSQTNSQTNSQTKLSHNALSKAAPELALSELAAPVQAIPEREDAAASKCAALAAPGHAVASALGYTAASAPYAASLLDSIEDKEAMADEPLLAQIADTVAAEVTKGKAKAKKAQHRASAVVMADVPKAAGLMEARLADHSMAVMATVPLDAEASADKVGMAHDLASDTGAAVTKQTWFYRVDMPEGYKNFSKTKPILLEHLSALAKWWDKREEIVTLGFAKAKAFSYEEIKARDFNLDLCGYPHEEEEILDPIEAMSAYQQQRASLNQEIDQVLAQIAAMLRDKA